MATQGLPQTAEEAGWATPDLPQTAQQAVWAGLQKLYKDTKHADFVLAVGATEWHVHKTVLLMHSEPLYKMSTAEGFQESKVGRAELHDVKAMHVDAMVEYMYHGGYSTPMADFSSSEDELHFHIGMVKLGQRFLIKPLEKYALNWLLDRFLLEQHLPHGIPRIYADEETPSIIKEMALNYITDSLDRWESSDHWKISKLVDEVPQFAADLVKALAKKGCRYRLVAG